MLMDIRCAFVLLVALAAMPCQAKPTEGAQPSVKGNLHDICINS